MSAPSMVRSRRPPLSADGRGRGLPAVSSTRRCRQSKRVAEIAENAGIDGNEVLACSRVTGKTLAEIADIPCKYFARETVRSFTVSLWGAVQTPVRHSIPNLRQMCPRHSVRRGRRIYSAAIAFGLTSSSAICTAFHAAPLRSWSPATNSTRPLGLERSRRMRPTWTSRSPLASIGIGK
jgi:hypothetical protein